jgi:prepilin-type N-terminal cleavage/methylation domain-containing protein
MAMRNNKGFTLIELVITMVILSIVHGIDCGTCKSVSEVFQG